MLKLSHWYKVATLLLALLLAACGGGSGGSAPPPMGGIVATPGNGQVTITWTASPGVEYWLIYAATATPIDIKSPPGNHGWATAITSPYVLTGLTNGVTYSFAMNARTGGGPGGAQSPSVSAVPRPAGANWIAGTTTLASDMHGVAYGTASDSSINYLAVGTGGALYKGPEGVSQGLTGMVWSKVAQSTPVDFRAATYTLSKFIAVGAATGGATNNVYYSADMSNWTAAFTPGNTALNAVASNGTTVVAVGDTGKVFYSTDGASWNAANALPAGAIPNLNGVAYSATFGWVAVGDGGALYTSPDAITWTAGLSNTTSSLHGVTATSAGVFVAVGDAGMVVTGTVANAGTSGWTAQTLGSTLYAVSTDSVQFVAVGQGGTVYTSTNGSNWTAATATGTTNTLFAVVGSASKYVAVGLSGTNISSIN